MTSQQIKELEAIWRDLNAIRATSSVPMAASLGDILDRLQVMATTAHMASDIWVANENHELIRHCANIERLLEKLNSRRRFLRSGPSFWSKIKQWLWNHGVI
jgi:hypothetical protein